MEGTVPSQSAGGQACKLVAAGTYKPSLQLMLLQPGNPAQPMVQNPVFHPVVSVDIAPLLQAALPTPEPLDPMAVLSSPEAASTSTRTKLEARGLEYMPEQIVPESIQLLNADSADPQLQVGNGFCRLLVMLKLLDSSVCHLQMQWWLLSCVGSMSCIGKKRMKRMLTARVPDNQSQQVIQ